MCTICGVEEESIFHCLVTCPKACALRFAMRDVWNIPGEEFFRCTGPDWFLILLDQLGSPVREQVLFIFWRAWHLRNDLIFGRGKESLSSSAIFVENYWKSFTATNAYVQVVMSNKGKGVVDKWRYATPPAIGHRVWEPPDPEYIKINVDPSFVESMRSASVGVVVRNDLGEVLDSSWDFIRSCTCVDEAKLRAALAGLYIGITLHKPFILETDYAFVVSCLARDSIDMSSLADLKMEALSVSKLIKDFKITKIDRRANRVAHEIAKFSFDSRSEGLLCNSVPPCVTAFVMNDCKNLNLPK
ncbi:hypothetical protein VPH35_072919 [Triticum aestivum]